MSSALPDLLDPRRAVESGERFVGRLSASSLPRLRELLLDSSGDVTFSLDFRRDEQRRAIVTGEVRAGLRLQCQRCLGPLEYEVNAKVALALVSGVDEAGQLPERYDPLLLTDALIRPRDLIEEELLLSLPQIPMHPAGYCEMRTQKTAPEAERDVRGAHPFAMLARWKRKE
jgi:uncharacterized protein